MKNLFIFLIFGLLYSSFSYSQATDTKRLTFLVQPTVSTGTTDDFLMIDPSSGLTKKATLATIASRIFDINGGGGFNQEEIEDIIGNMVTGNTEVGITVSYNDTTGKLNFTIESIDSADITNAGGVLASSLGDLATLDVITIDKITTIGTPSSSTYLRGDGTWNTPPGGGGSGTVTSIAVSGSDGIEVDSGSPITTSGTIALGINAATLRTTINVEDGADVTNTANVTAAGALMNSEVDVDIKTLSLPASTTISSFGATLINTFDTGAARTLLGLGTLSTLNSVSSSNITNSTILNEDISASAGITINKLSTIGATTGYAMVANGLGGIDFVEMPSSSSGDVMSDGSIPFTGNVSVSTNGSSEASPRIIGYTDLSATEAMRFQFGDPYNGITSAEGKGILLGGYHTLHLNGGRGDNNGPVTLPYVTNIPTVATLLTIPYATKTFRVKGAPSHTAALQEWTNSDDVPQASVSANGTFNGSGLGLSGVIKSNITGLTGAEAITNMVKGTQAEIASWPTDATRVDVCENCPVAAVIASATEINLSDYYQYNMAAANSSATYTLIDIRAGGVAEILINKSGSAPTVTGATQLPNTATFIPSTDMILTIKVFGSTVKYFFTEF